MAKTAYDATSPYYSTPQTRWYLGPIKLRNILPDLSDQTMVVAAKYHNRPDLLSYDLYGTPAYWWVFMLCNMDLIRDPIWDLTSGMTIRAPAASRLISITV
jgi:hypothetical protein